MKYFAKCLPIEGEIKEGDHILINNIIGIVGSAVEFFEGCKKVKLFLCSRDIQVGDEIKAMWYFNDGSLSYQWGIVTGDGADNELVPLPNYWNVKIPTKTEKRIFKKGDLFGKSTGEMIDVFMVKELPKEYSFKVLGEISPEATWVKEGDEFEDFQLRKVFENNIFDKTVFDTGIYKILGPCGHFH